MRQQTAEENPGAAAPRRNPVLPPQNAKAQVLSRLVAGFIVIVVLLGLDGFVGLFGTRSVQTSLSALERQETQTAELLGELQAVQSALATVQYRLPSASNQNEAAALKDALSGVERTLQALFRQVPPNDPDATIWHEVEIASSHLTADLDSWLSHSPGTALGLSQLVADREGLFKASEKLTRSNHERSEATRQQIEEITTRQSIEDRVLLSACLLVASLFLWTSTRIYYRLTEQSAELNRVSWQLLERQELVAQRLSRELHDELGQSLTALKTNFSRHASSGFAEPSWVQDCTELLKESIRSAHEISQLLRPTLLDDFGLDSALSWLCERFEERNSIQVRYHSDFHWRLDEQAETHIFRIAQEALTNVARHSEATKVDVLFSKQFGMVRLNISDNGVGLKPRAPGALAGFGLTGMKARARSLQGEMKIESGPGRGTAIEVIFPARPAQ